MIQEVFDSVDKICALVHEAGKAILEFYKKPDLKVHLKGDNTPVTEADFASHKILSQGLNAMFPLIPMVSEENSNEANLKASNSDCFWSADPLDGTQNFVSGKETFTTNLALIKDGEPVFGLLNIPLANTLYCGFNRQAFKTVQGKTHNIKSLNTTKISNIVISKRADMSMVEEIKNIISPDAVVFTHHSAHKYCLLAEGKADMFLCYNPTCEWDSAAGHAIISAIGGEVFTLDGKLLRYGRKNADFINPYFIVIRDRAMLIEGKVLQV